ncbi:hypothetical protein DAPPUDRAFT_310335 [Daphnia pulex]|uniref:Uncharacterized protein n=1 Tax=Daphnia pulex TaxID=6669 RepID=E9FTA6_DAPPU|nr:hypothetical protein DAPPUDRAFT_310335 [Daphnia pulex]|eukprot:EFX89678.1 hypothetical protein DAPPUDRAFT_310335 [Daphnia pulex]
MGLGWRDEFQPNGSNQALLSSSTHVKSSISTGQQKGEGNSFAYNERGAHLSVLISLVGR